MGKPQQAKKRLVPKAFRHIGTLQNIEEYELKKNGLRILFRQDTNAPVVGFMVTYLVGSRHEVAGYTGATHILEHLMFKGSKKFPPKNGVSVLDTLSKKGALVNASTFLDRTNYFEVIPKEHFDFVVQLEADRMRNACISKKDIQAELPAVLSEYAMSAESDPEAYLDERIWATAFMAHPYHHPTIGWLSDIEHITLDRLKSFYDTYYQPNNAVVTIVGDIDRVEALKTVQTHFGVHKKVTRDFPQPHTTEPEQNGKRFVEVHRAGTKNLVGVAYKVPEALHVDTPAVLALSSILGDGKTSRLHRAVVETGMASEVWSMYIPFYDPSLLMFWATPARGFTHEAVEKAIVDTCEKGVTKGVTKTELQRVSANMLTEMAAARDGQYATLSTINESIATGDWRFFYTLPQAIKRLTQKKVQEVAKKYLKKTNMTVGYYRADEVT